jgi:hypothetical protein
VTSIFISYRAGDDAYAAALLDERLSQVFGTDQIFRASRSIMPGKSYTTAIMQALNACDVLLAVIGPTWTGRIKEAGTRPEHRSPDWVRTEIETALRRDIRIIPILLSRVPRLEADELPADITDLAYRQYLRFEHRNVDRDIVQLVAALNDEYHPSRAVARRLQTASRGVMPPTGPPCRTTGRAVEEGSNPATSTTPVTHPGMPDARHRAHLP